MLTRQFIFSDGSTNKFWTIQLQGTTQTITFGRSGTDGQSRSKEFPDDEKAQKSFDKLIQQKLSKGYVEAPVAGATPAAKNVKNGEIAPESKKTEIRKQSTTKKATTPAAVKPSQQVDLTITQTIDLKPEDWFVARFREPAMLERKPAGEPDLDAAISQFQKIKTTRHGWELQYEALNLPAILPREEAHFWFTAMTGRPERLVNSAAVARYVKKIAGQGNFDGKLTLDAARQAVSQIERDAPKSLMLPLFSLFSAEECMDIILSDRQNLSLQQNYVASYKKVSLCTSFRQYVLPYMSNNEIQNLQSRVRKSLDASYIPLDPYTCFPVEHYAAAMLGMHDEIHQAVASWEDDAYSGEDKWSTHYHRPQLLLCGLGSAELIEAEWRRLNLPFESPEQVRDFLACTALSALDIPADGICRQNNKDVAAKMLRIFCLIRAPEAAEPMLQCRMQSKAAAIARDWLDTYVGNAVQGLIHTAGGKGKLADAAIDYLRGVKRAGHEDLIAKAIEHAEVNSEATTRVQEDVIDQLEKVYQPFNEQTTPAWLTEALDEVQLGKKVKLPTWANATALPPLTIDEHRLTDEHISILLALLAATPVTEKHPTLVAFKNNIDATVRDDFAWCLFELWQQDGLVTKNKWAMGAIGHMGDDECALKLTPLVRIWPGESQHARAVFGLQCLRGVGSNTALMQLSGIAQKLKFKGLKNKAALFVDEIAEERGMSREELEDRVIPDCGLDSNGRREFSFGERTFSFVLSGELKPMVRDSAGKVRPNMPKPGVKDNQEVANASLTEWKLIKKQIKEVATLQAARLEQAMVTGRRWLLDDFVTLYVKHPLMTHLTQKLLWGCFDSTGTLNTLFRITEERDFANIEDEAISLDEKHTIGLMHRLDMSDAQCSAWGEVLADYEIVAPFPQLGRDVYRLQTGEQETTDLSRFAGIELAAPSMVFTLEKLGWARGTAMDAGGFDEHSKQFPAADVTAVIHYDGIVGMGYIDPDEMLKTESIYFCQGMRSPTGYGGINEERLLLKNVPPIVISEVMADLNVLQSKVK